MGVGRSDRATVGLGEVGEREYVLPHALEHGRHLGELARESVGNALERRSDVLCVARGDDHRDRRDGHGHLGARDPHNNDTHEVQLCAHRKTCRIVYG